MVSHEVVLEQAEQAASGVWCRLALDSRVRVLSPDRFNYREAAVAIFATAGAIAGYDSLWGSSFGLVVGAAAGLGAALAAETLAARLRRFRRN